MTTQPRRRRESPVGKKRTAIAQGKLPQRAGSLRNEMSVLEGFEIAKRAAIKAEQTQGRGRVADPQPKNQLPVMPDILPLPPGDLPPSLVQADTELRQLYLLVKGGGGWETCDAAVLYHYARALASWVTESNAYLSAEFQAPSRMLNPRLRHAGVEFLSVLANNAAAFVAPVALAAALGPELNSWQDAGVFFGLVTALQTSAGEFSSATTRWLKGAVPQVVLTGPRSSPTPFGNAMGSLLLVAIRLVAYASTHAALSSAPVFSATVGGQVGRTILSGTAMAATSAALTYGGARLTLLRDGVTDTRYLAKMQNNKHAKSGLRLFEPVEFRQRTSLRNKTVELMAKAGALLLGNAAAFGIWGALIHPNTKPLPKSAIEIALAFNVLFAIAGVVEAIWTHLYNDPNFKPNKFGIASHEITKNNLRASTMRTFDKSLDAVSLLFDDKFLQETAPHLQEAYAISCALMTGSQFRQQPRDQGTVAMYIGYLERRLTRLADIATAAATHELSVNDYDSEDADHDVYIGTCRNGDADFDASVPIAGELKMMQQSLRGAVKCLQHLDPLRPRDLQDASIEPYVQSLNENIRTAFVWLVKCQMLLGTPGFTAAGESATVSALRREAQARIDVLLVEFLPLMSAQRLANRIALSDAFMNLLEAQLRQGSGRLTAVHFGDAERQRAVTEALEQSNLLLNEIAYRFRHRIHEDQVPAMLTAAEGFLREVLRSEPAAHINARITYLRGAVNATHSGGPRENAIQHVLDRVARADTENTREARIRLGVWIRERLENGKDVKDATGKVTEIGFTVNEFSVAVERLRSASDSGVPRIVDIEAPAAPEPALPRAMEQLDLISRSLGEEYLTALTAQVPGMSSDNYKRLGDLSTGGAEIVTALMDDMSRMPAAHRDPLLASFQVPVPSDLPEVVSRVQSDMHHHPDNYNNRQNYLRRLTEWLGMHDVLQTTLMGIPSQIRMPEPLDKYYATSKKRLVYHAKDLRNLMTWWSLPEARRLRHIPMMTDTDVTNASNMRKDMDQTLRISMAVAIADMVHSRDRGGLQRLMRPNWTVPLPGIRNKGEYTFKKEIVSDKNPQRPEIDGAGLRNMIHTCFEDGSAFTIHNDRGDQHDKARWGGEFIRVVKDAYLQMRYNAAGFADRLLLPGVRPEELAPRAGVMTWAHVCGLSRFAETARDHTMFMVDVFMDEDLQFVRTDLSWMDVSLHVVTEMRGLLEARGVSPTLQQSLTDWLKAFGWFDIAATRADTGDDAGMTMASSLHGVSSDGAALKSMMALESMRNMALIELKKPEVRDAIMRMITEHGDDGNNFLFLLSAFANKIAFGTDALTVGSKKQGDAAYALNTKMYWPLYEIFEEMGRQFPDPVDVTIPAGKGRPQKTIQVTLSEVSPQLRYRTFDETFNDPELLARQAAYQEYLFTTSPYDYTAIEPPRQFTRRTVVSQGLIDFNDQQQADAYAMADEVVFADESAEFMAFLRARDPEFAMDVEAIVVGGMSGVAGSVSSSFVPRNPESVASVESRPARAPSLIEPVAGHPGRDPSRHVRSSSSAGSRTRPFRDFVTASDTRGSTSGSAREPSVGDENSAVSNGGSPGSRSSSTAMFRGREPATAFGDFSLASRQRRAASLSGIVPQQPGLLSPSWTGTGARPSSSSSSRLDTTTVSQGSPWAPDRSRSVGELGTDTGDDGRYPGRMPRPSSMAPEATSRAPRVFPGADSSRRTTTSEIQGPGGASTAEDEVVAPVGETAGQRAPSGATANSRREQQQPVTSQRGAAAAESSASGAAGGSSTTAIPRRPGSPARQAQPSTASAIGQPGMGSNTAAATLVPGDQDSDDDGKPSADA